MPYRAVSRGVAVGRAVLVISYRTMPCPVVSPPDRFGADYYSFWFGGVRGLVLNTHLWASSSANPVSGLRGLTGLGECGILFIYLYFLGALGSS